jgi:Ulp1 protease family, C-terminal catalytic domain
MKTFKQIRCHLGKKTRKKHTCFDDKTIFFLRDLWNLRHRDVKISETNPEKIWIALKNNLKNCSHEICWIDSVVTDVEVKKKLKKLHFAPRAPLSWNKNKNEWLSSVDISNVLEQYKTTNTEFTYLGPSPIDFDVKVDEKICVWPELCKLNIKEKYDRGIRKIGIVFNLDKHNQSGSHWVALFINLTEKYIFYFDSCAPKKLPPEITRLMNRILEQCKNINMNMKKIINTFPHQRGNTECGMYVLYFIICLLENIKKPHEFIKYRIPDQEVEMFRNIYFNKLEDN